LKDSQLIMYSQLKKIWTGNRHIKLHQDHFFRFIYPTTVEHGLNSFYGNDRSFCQGIFFDTTDLIVEFTLDPSQTPNAIAHHQFSYRGRLQPDDIKIIGIYFRNPPLDYLSTDFQKHFKTLIEQVPEGTYFYRYRGYKENEVIIYAIWQKSNVFVK
jgi:hypothetical protein